MKMDTGPGQLNPAGFYFKMRPHFLQVKRVWPDEPVRITGSGVVCAFRSMQRFHKYYGSG